MSKYRGYSIRRTNGDWLIDMRPFMLQAQPTKCDSLAISKRVIDDRIRSGRWPDLTALPGQMRFDDILGGEA